MPSMRAFSVANPRRVRERAGLVEPVGHRQRLAVIGNGDVLEPGVARGQDHRLEVVLPVGLGRVHVQVAAQIGGLDERGSRRSAAASISPRCSRSSGGTQARPSAS